MTIERANEVIANATDNCVLEEVTYSEIAELLLNVAELTRACAVHDENLDIEEQDEVAQTLLWEVSKQLRGCAKKVVKCDPYYR